VEGQWLGPDESDEVLPNGFWILAWTFSKSCPAFHKH
jgi:hypothetical protein